MEERKLVPKRRFMGYADEWKEHRLGEIAQFNPNSTLPDTFEYVDLESVVGTKLIGHRTESRESAPSRAQRLAVRGDVFFQTVRPYQKNNYLFDLPYENYVFSTGYAQIRPNVDSYFLLGRVQEESFLRRVLDRCTGTSYPAINSNDLADINIKVPTDKLEQTKIGKFFKQLDENITLQQCKLEKTKALKSAYLAEMFPAEGELVPKRRFAGFTDKWKVRKLGDLGSVAMNKRIFKEQTSEKGDVPFYKIGTFGGEPDAFITRELFEAYKAKYPFPEVGDILISASGSIGRTVEYTGKDEYFQDSNIVWLKHDGRLNNSFLKQYYKVVNWSGLEGSTIKRLYNKDILETQIKVPSLNEQHKIGTFFKKLDDKITNQERKLDKLKAMKQAYLHEMFV